MELGAAAFADALNKIETIEKIVIEISTFLITFIDLANAHPVDFIVKDLWNTVLPIHIREPLSTLSLQELADLPSGSLFQSHLNSDLKTASLETMLCDLASKLERLKIKHDETDQDDCMIKDKNTAACKNKDCACVNNAFPRGNYSPSAVWHSTSLQEFLTCASSYCLDNVQVECVDHTFERPKKWGQDMKANYANTTDNGLLVHAFMKEKKMHEVEKMANLCRQLFTSSRSDVVLDLGSGKGYLSTCLSMQHQLPVIAIDSQAINTSGAEQRSERVRKEWDHRVNVEKRKVKKSHNSGDFLDSVFVNKCTVETNAEKRVQQTNFKKVVASCETGNMLSDQELAKCEAASATCTCSEYTSSQFSVHSQKLHTDRSSISLEGPKCVNLTMFVSPDTNLDKIVRESVKSVCTDLSAKYNFRLFLTGLHTCGSLACSMLHLFIRVPSVKSMCNVGCCYQLMREKFLDAAGNSLSSTNVKQPDSSVCDFPLSSILHEQQMVIGRTALNVASLALPRMKQQTDKLQGMTFYPRALLQAFIHWKLGYVPQNLNKLRNVSKHCSDPVDYVVKSLQKLGLKECEIQESEILAFHEQHMDQQMKMAAFFQLRAALAPAVETVVLLDRLLFLLQQDCVREAFLVRLFDPVTSPRCYAIVAFKKDGADAT